MNAGHLPANATFLLVHTYAAQNELNDGVTDAMAADNEARFFADDPFWCAA